VRAQQHRRGQRGSFTVEFALVFPVLVAIMFALIDVGRFIATRTMLAQAAAAAARTACLSSTTNANATTAIPQGATDAAPTLAGLTATAACTAACNFPLTAGTPVRVTVTYNFVAGFFKMFGKSMQNFSLVTC
jgi:Flp pilus assembly protein TadG